MTTISQEESFKLDSFCFKKNSSQIISFLTATYRVFISTIYVEKVSKNYISTNHPREIFHPKHVRFKRGEMTTYLEVATRGEQPDRKTRNSVTIESADNAH